MSNLFSLPAIITDKIDLSDYSVRQKIEIVEWYMHKAVDNIVSDLPIHEYISDGILFREMTIPEGILLTGKIHLHKHLFTVIEGDIELATDDFSERIHADIENPFVAIIPGNSKKLGYAHKKSIVATFHKIGDTNESIDEINNRILADSDLTWVDALMAAHGITEDNIMRIEQ